MWIVYVFPLDVASNITALNKKFLQRDEFLKQFQRAVKRPTTCRVHYWSRVNRAKKYIQIFKYDQILSNIKYQILSNWLIWYAALFIQLYSVWVFIIEDPGSLNLGFISKHLKSRSRKRVRPSHFLVWEKKATSRHSLGLMCTKEDAGFLHSILNGRKNKMNDS